MFRPYENAQIGLATKHAKKTAIAPIFKSILGAEVIDLDVDTDILGAFSGEVPRIGSALETVKRKCEMGIEKGFFDFCLASEGSFGPHPDYPFIPCDQEILYFIDNLKKIHVWATIFSNKTNYNFKKTTSFPELLEFSKKVKFPTHALIIRPNIWENKNHIFKGVQTEEGLKYSLEVSMKRSKDGAAWVETDMRAHMNPSRMSVIQEVARKLANQLNTPCPQCNSPGWGIKRVERGLKCSYCSFETDWVKSEIYGCVFCSCEFKQLRSDGIMSVDPSMCKMCNP